MVKSLSPKARAVLDAAARRSWWTDSAVRGHGLYLGDGREGFPADVEPDVADAIIYAVNNIAKVEAGLAAALEWVKDHEDVNYEGTGPNDAMALGQEIREAMVRVEGKTTQC